MARRLARRSRCRKQIHGLALLEACPDTSGDLCRKSEKPPGELNSRPTHDQCRQSVRLESGGWPLDGFTRAPIMDVNVLSNV